MSEKIAKPTQVLINPLSISSKIPQAIPKRVAGKLRASAKAFVILPLCMILPTATNFSIIDCF